MRTLDTFKEFSYNYYENCDKLRNVYERMFGIIKASGHALTPNEYLLDAGILLEDNNDNVIAGAFLNLSKYATVLIILIIYVDEGHRQSGIYTKIHMLIDQIGIKQSKKQIYSYIHMKNQIMQEHIMKKIGYEPIMQLVSRPVKGNKNETN